jgi:hypothetical protein
MRYWFLLPCRHSLSDPLRPWKVLCHNWSHGSNWHLLCRLLLCSSKHQRYWNRLSSRLLLLGRFQPSYPLSCRQVLIQYWQHRPRQLLCLPNWKVLREPWPHSSHRLLRSRLLLPWRRHRPKTKRSNLCKRIQMPYSKLLSCKMRFKLPRPNPSGRMSHLPSWLSMPCQRSHRVR